jgi:hypothetical protein
LLLENIMFWSFIAEMWNNRRFQEKEKEEKKLNSFDTERLQLNIRK